jgi:hypothetical protein
MVQNRDSEEDMVQKEEKKAAEAAQDLAQFYQAAAQPGLPRAIFRVIASAATEYSPWEAK